MAHPKVGNKYVRHDDYYELQVQYKGDIWYSAYIDLDDYEYVSQHPWRTAHKRHKVYLITSVGVELTGVLIGGQHGLNCGLY